MTITLAVLVALATGVVEAVKLFKVPKRFIPLVAILVGVCLNLVFRFGGDVGQQVLIGIAIGLSSAGLFDFAKKTVAGK